MECTSTGSVIGFGKSSGFDLGNIAYQCWDRDLCWFTEHGNPVLRSNKQLWDDDLKRDGWDNNIHILVFILLSTKKNWQPRHHNKHIAHYQILYIKYGRRGSVYRQCASPMQEGLVLITYTHSSLHVTLQRHSAR